MHTQCMCMCICMCLGTRNSLFTRTLRQRDMSAQQIANSGPEIVDGVVLQLLIEYLLMAVVGNETS